MSVIVPIQLWREITSERETAYLLKSEKMQTRLLEAKERSGGFSLDNDNRLTRGTDSNYLPGSRKQN